MNKCEASDIDDTFCAALIKADSKICSTKDCVAHKLCPGACKTCSKCVSRRIQAVYGLWYSDMDPSEYQSPYTAWILGL